MSKTLKYEIKPNKLNNGVFMEIMFLYCQNKCKLCPNSNNLLQSLDHYELLNIKTKIDEWSNHLKDSYIIIKGGEPLLYLKEIKDIVKIAKRHSIKIIFA